jgi:hypothetical protein
VFRTSPACATSSVAPDIVVVAITECIGQSVTDMTQAERDWSRLNRAVEQTTLRLAAAQFEEDFQSIGPSRPGGVHFSRAGHLRSGATPFGRCRHAERDRREENADRLCGGRTAGSGNEEARKFARAAVMYADAVNHKRSATRIDAELVVCRNRIGRQGHRDSCATCRLLGDRRNSAA